MPTDKTDLDVTLMSQNYKLINLIFTHLQNDLFFIFFLDLSMGQPINPQRMTFFKFTKQSRFHTFHSGLYFQFSTLIYIFFFNYIIFF